MIAQWYWAKGSSSGWPGWWHDWRMLALCGAERWSDKCGCVRLLSKACRAVFLPREG